MFSIYIYIICSITVVLFRHAVHRAEAWCAEIPSMLKTHDCDWLNHIKSYLLLVKPYLLLVKSYLLLVKSYLLLVKSYVLLVKSY